MKPPLTEAMTQLLKGAGKSQAYNVGNETVFENWRWNSDHGLPESVMALRRLLALDPRSARPRRAWLVGSGDALFRKQADPRPVSGFRRGPRRAAQLSGRAHVLQPRRVRARRCVATCSRSMPTPPGVHEGCAMTELRFYHLHGSAARSRAAAASRSLAVARLAGGGAGLVGGAGRGDRRASLDLSRRQLPAAWHGAQCRRAPISRS